MTQIVKKRRMLYPLLSTILVIYMIAINNMANTSLSILLVMVSGIFIFKPLYILPPLFIASLNENFFVAFQGISISRIMVLIFIIGSLMKFIKNSTKIKFKHVLFLILILGFTFVSAATSIIGDIIPAIGMSLSIVMFSCMIYTEVDDIETFISTLTLSIIIYSFSILITILSGNALYISDRLVIDSSVNANRIGMALGQMAAYLFGLILLVRKTKFKLIFVILLISNVTILLITGSRSATVGLIIGMLALVLIKLLKEKRISKKIITIATLALLFTGVYLSISNFDIPALQRFSIHSVIESGGTNRLIIWDALIKNVIPNNLLFGVGFGGANVMYAVAPYVIVPHGTHNMLLTIIVQMGIVGFLIYFLFYIISTKVIFRGYMKYDYLGIPLVMILTAYGNGIGEEIFNTRFLWFAIGLGFMLLKYFNGTLLVRDGHNNERK